MVIFRFKNRLLFTDKLKIFIYYNNVDKMKRRDQTMVREIYIDIITEEKDVLKRLIPFSMGEVREALDNGDNHLNTLNIQEWNNACGCSLDGNKIDIFDYTLYDLMKKYNLNASLSSMVSLLKNAAVFYSKNK